MQLCISKHHSPRANAVSRGPEPPTLEIDGHVFSNRLRNNQGVQAIFAVTNFWDHVFTGSSMPESRDKEVEQGI